MRACSRCLVYVLALHAQTANVDGAHHHTRVLNGRLRGGFAGAPRLPAPVFDVTRQDGNSLAVIAKKPRHVGRGAQHVAAAAPSGRPQVEPAPDDRRGTRRRIGLFLTTLLRTVAVQVALMLSIFFLDPGRAQAGLVYDGAVAEMEAQGPPVVYMDDWYHGGGGGRGTPDAEEATPHPHKTEYERGERRQSAPPEPEPERRMPTQTLFEPVDLSAGAAKSYADFEKSEHIHPEVAKARAALFGTPETRAPVAISETVSEPGASVPQEALCQETWVPADESVVTEPISTDDAGPAVKQKRGFGAIKDEIISSWRTWAGADGLPNEPAPSAAIPEAPAQAPEAVSSRIMTPHTSSYTRDDRGGGDDLLAWATEKQHFLRARLPARQSSSPPVQTPAPQQAMPHVSVYTRGLSSAGDSGLVGSLAKIVRQAAMIPHVTDCVSTRGAAGGDHVLVVGEGANVGVVADGTAEGGRVGSGGLGGGAVAATGGREQYAWESLSRDTSMSEMEVPGNASPEPSVESEPDRSPSKTFSSNAQQILGSSGSVPLVTHQASYVEDEDAYGTETPGVGMGRESGSVGEMKIHPEVAKARAVLQEQQRQAAELLADNIAGAGQAASECAGREAGEGGVGVSRVSSVDFKAAHPEAAGDAAEEAAHAASMRSLMLKAILGAIVYGQAEEVRTHVVQPAVSFAGKQALHGAKALGSAGLSLGKSAVAQVGFMVVGETPISRQTQVEIKTASPHAKGYQKLDPIVVRGTGGGQTASTSSNLMQSSRLAPIAWSGLAIVSAGAVASAALASAATFGGKRAPSTGASKGETSKSSVSWGQTATDATQALTNAVQRLSERLAAQGAAALGFELAADAAQKGEGKAPGGVQHELDSVEQAGAGGVKEHGRQDTLQAAGSDAVAKKTTWQPPTGYVPRKDAQPAGLAASAAERDGVKGAAAVDEDTPFLKNAPAWKDERLVELLQSSGTASLASSAGQEHEQVSIGAEQRKSLGVPVAAGAAEPAPNAAEGAKEDAAAAAVGAVWQSIKAAAMDAAKEALNVRQPHISSVLASLQQEAGARRASAALVCMCVEMRMYLRVCLPGPSVEHRHSQTVRV